MDMNASCLEQFNIGTIKTFVMHNAIRLIVDKSDKALIWQKTYR